MDANWTVPRVRDHEQPGRGSSRRRASDSPNRRRAETIPERWPMDAVRGRLAPGIDIMLLQRLAGNRAVGTLLRGASMQRDIGWPDARDKGWNKEPRTVDAKHRMVRLPLAGLTKGNREKSPNKAKTDEEADGRVIAWVHPDLKPTEAVQVLVHLHGLTSRPVDPFAGWRENNADPKTDESAKAMAAWKDAAKKARRAKKPEPDAFVNPLANKVRDVERDRIGQQIEEISDPQIMAVLPQGTGLGGDSAFGKDFDADAIVDEVLKRLKTEGQIGEIKNYTIILSAHSAGGAAVASALRGKRTSRVGGLILFDALWGEPSKDDPTKTVSRQRDALLNWIKAGCEGLAPVLKDPAKTPADKKAAIAALPGVRGIWEGGYARTYEDLQSRIDATVKASIPRDYVQAVKSRFVITKVGTTHDQIVGGSGAAGGPLRDALQQRKTFVAQKVSCQVQRGSPGATKTATVKLSWKGQLQNEAKLKTVLAKHPADLSAHVQEHSKDVATGDTPVTFDVPATPVSHKLTVKPTAAAPGDYFLPKRTAVTVEAGKTTEAAVTLPFNRNNARFTERTWELAGIDVTKANNVAAATLFGKTVIGGLNALVAPKVAAANKWFTDTKNISAADQTAAQTSIVSIVGQVKRTQSRGTYSNHSTGVAIDINPSNETLQNWHVKKSDKHHAQAMKVFNMVVSQQSAFDQLATSLAGLFIPGIGNLSPFKNFDVWKEKDRDRLLQASERFNAFFPSYLQTLAATAVPGQTPAPTTDSVMALTAGQLEALAKKATAAKKDEVAAALRAVAQVWFEVRAWVGGYVITNKKKGGEPLGMLRGDFDKAQAKDPTLKSKGELTGMISLHPAIVKSLTESGWSWLVDYKHNNEKDFMHFEDRGALEALKK